MDIQVILLCDQVGNNQWKYHYFGVTVQAETKEQADALMTEMHKVCEEAVEKNGTWHYKPFGLRVSAANKKDADMAAVSRHLGKLNKSADVAPKEGDAVVKPAKVA